MFSMGSDSGPIQITNLWRGRKIGVIVRRPSNVKVRFRKINKIQAKTCKKLIDNYEERLIAALKKCVFFPLITENGKNHFY